jgi:short-subunit dehydrogenase
MAIKQTALVTGASSGIGLELARVFAENSYNLVLTARREEKLQELAGELRGHDISVEVIPADLSRREAPTEILQQLQERGISVDVLVNNAGFATYGLFDETELQDELNLITVNISALTHLTKLLLPGMIERKNGYVFNVASTAAFQPGPFMAVYYASKAYVLSFSEALANELEGTGVSVTALCPGLTQSGFQERAQMQKSNLARGPMMDARTVALAGYEAMIKGQTIAIPGRSARLFARMVRFLPRATAVNLVRRAQAPASKSE